MKKKIYYSLSLISFLTCFTGCDIGTNSNNNNKDNNNIHTSINISGKVADGAISNAHVFIDTNNNNEFDNNELDTYTDEHGNYIFNVKKSDFLNKKLIAENGTDTQSGLQFNGFLKTTIGNENTTNITPLTTILEAQVHMNNNLKESLKNISTALNISEKDITADITKKPDLFNKVLLIQKLFDIANIYSTNKEELINFISDYSNKITSTQNYSNLIDLLKIDIMTKYNIEENLLDFIVTKIQKQDNQLKMDLIVKILKEEKSNKHKTFSIKTVKNRINQLDNENENIRLTKLKIGFNKYNYNLTEKEYNFFSSRYPEFSKIKFDNIKEEIKSITNPQLKDYFEHIIYEDFDKNEGEE